MNLDKLKLSLSRYLESLNGEERVEVINALRALITQYSPFSFHPIDCVQWIPVKHIMLNDYNPNTMSPVESRLLRVSLLRNGYTQPVVTHEKHGKYVIVDGEHRFSTGCRTAAIAEKLLGYMPVVKVNSENTTRTERIAATVRHNRARGTHRVDAMSEIVLDLSRLGWSNEKIGTELGMEPDEVLRLRQLSGLETLFRDESFSEAWTTDFSEE
ncbi:TPA: ParB N-terminal domain-containing protein [Citrobacter freundii]|nr:ParB N-terminal domain-containing protein [Citrobacter freundii]